MPRYITVCPGTSVESVASRKTAARPTSVHLHSARMHARMRARMHARMRARMHARAHTRTHARTQGCVCMCTHACLCACAHVHMLVHVHACVCVCTRVCTCLCLCAMSQDLHQQHYTNKIKRCLHGCSWSLWHWKLSRWPGRSFWQPLLHRIKYCELHSSHQ